ncbi:MAG TPA: VOC family protein [Thermoleophilaceae bacterium]|nr:VOC family protein [Thermoleophilaceae bacterium]
MLQHVTLEMRREDRAEAEAFWRRLGFEAVEPPGTLAEVSAWLERDGTQIHLLWSENPVAAPEGHAAVVVDDYDAVVAQLRAEEYEVEDRAEQWGVPRSFVRAPGGHRIELMSAPPPRGR